MQVYFLRTPYTHWWRALIYGVFTLRPRLMEAPCYEISQVTGTGNRVRRTIDGLYNASEEKRHTALLLNSIGKSKT